MDQCTHEVRRQYWKNIITQCNQRPEGQTAKQWLDAHGICEQTYYRWQRLIRREILGQTASVSRTLPSAENFAWFREKADTVAQKGKTHEGFQYSLNQERYLKRFLEDGGIPMDNNAAKQSIRGFCIGKRIG